MLHQAVALPGGSYDILIESGLLLRTGQIFRDLLPDASSVLLVTDENVAPLYAQVVADSLAGEGYRVRTVVLPAGEETKMSETVNHLYTQLCDFSVGAGDAVVALGGGVIADTVGFAAATWLGGVAMVQIPTTLTAQADSAVGGKYAINLAAGKDLIGTIWPPKCVLVDPDCLMSLSERDFSSGMATVIQIACVADAMLFDLLRQCAGRAGVMARAEEIVLDCCRQKERLLSFGGEVPQLLEYGHTFSRAIETAYRYRKCLYGEALAEGIGCANAVGELLGLTPMRITRQVNELLTRYHLPTETDLPGEALRRALLRGREIGSSASVILLEEIGHARRKTLSLEELLSLCAGT